MPSTRRYRRGWTLLVPALALSAALQLGAAAVYVAVRPVPPPVLWVDVTAAPEASGTVLVHVLDGDRTVTCLPTEPCRVELARGDEVTVDAIPGPDTTFDGWDGCVPLDDSDVLRCHFGVYDSTAIGVSFGAAPTEVDIAMVDVPAAPDEIALPAPFVPPPAATPPRPKTPEEIAAEKLEEQPVEVALVKPVPVPPPPPPTPTEPPPPAPPQAPQQPPPPNMTMVEVPDEHEVEDAPDDATHLSDKNRDVAEETRATETNLEKEHKGEAIASAPSDVQSDEIGGADDSIHQLEDSEATTPDRAPESIETGRSDHASGVETGDEGDDGDEGTGETKEPGMLAMRGIEGRGAVQDQGDGHEEGKRGKEGVKTHLEFDDYERIVGKDKAEKERAIARREKSMKKGRYQKKIEAIKSALENFTPDVRPGNQTALKTRASPFAVYIARMHRRIHELWGFGFLDDLDGKPADSPLNNFDLFASIEVSLNPDGSIYKMTVAKTSGLLEYDVAALHTIEASSPYGQTPEKIRSVDGRVYLRWGFYRNWRQCGTFNVEPYILTDIPGGVVPLPSDMDTSDGSSVATVDDDVAGGEEPAESPASIARGTKPVTPEPPKGSGASGGDETADHVHAGATSDAATYAANMWVAGFSSASVTRMLKVSATPFYAGGEVAASNAKELQGVYEGLIVESGALKSWELMTAEQYTQKLGVPIELAEGTLVLLVEAKEAFAIVLTPTKGGDYVANAVIR